MILFVLGCSITLNILLILFIVFVYKFKNDDLFLTKYKGVVSNEKRKDEFDDLLEENKENTIMRNYFFGNDK